MRCPACGFWKLNEFLTGMRCKKCGFVNKPIEEINQITEGRKGEKDG